MTKILVDGKEIDVPPEYTLLQACEAAGAEIRQWVAASMKNASVTPPDCKLGKT